VKVIAVYVPSLFFVIPLLIVSLLPRLRVVIVFPFGLPFPCQRWVYDTSIV